MEPPMSVPNPTGAVECQPVRLIPNELNEHTSSYTNQCSFSPARASSSQIPVFRIECIPNDVVHRFSRHERVRNTRLTIQYSAKVPQLPDHFTFIDFFFPCPGFSFKSPQPTNIAHRRLDIFYVELIFKRHRQSV